MTDDLPDPDRLYQALLDRDPAYDGRVFVAVSSTGIFCRLTCPARKPRRENCTFHTSVGACLAAGYRACLRCHPMADDDPLLTRLLAALEARPAHRWTEADVAALGIDPSTARRAFRRRYDITFLEMARLRRLHEGFVTLREGGRVIEAQLDAGFASASAFRAAFARLMGRAPGKPGRDVALRADWIATPLGDMIAVGCRERLHLLEFAERRALPGELRRLARRMGGEIGIGRSDPVAQVAGELAAYFAGQGARFDTPLALHGSEFALAVWQALREIPKGETRSYAALARALGRPDAVRAVARANGANQLAIVVPCHRVLGSDGALTGYGGGLWRKQRLLEIERARPPAAIA